MYDSSCIIPIMPSNNIEYKNKKGETPFETFLRYSDEKEKSSKLLAEVLVQNNLDGVSILDIGTGNGAYLAQALARIPNSSIYNLTLLEPSHVLAAQLLRRFKTILSKEKLTVLDKPFEEFVPTITFDVILASHVFYHFPREKWPEYLDKMLAMLSPDGRLIIVLRGKADPYKFMQTFKSRLTHKAYSAATTEDLLAVLYGMHDLRVTGYRSEAQLKFPLYENLEDTKTIIEFYLNNRWDKIPTEIQEESLKFIEGLDCVFKQIDAITVVSKVPKK